MAQLIKAPDGSIWLAGRNGFISTKKKVEIKPQQLELIVPEVEPPPPKKKKKTYKLHYTKPWSGTYGKFLQTFGNLYPHAPAQFQPTWDQKQLGNIFFKYDPGQRSIFINSRVYNDRLYVAYYFLHTAGQLKPGNHDSFPNINELRKAFEENFNYQIQQTQSGVVKFGIPLSSEFKLPDLVEEVEEEEVVEHRGCEGEYCTWCNPEVEPSTDGGKPLPRCEICGSLHKWTACIVTLTVGIKNILYDQNDWTVEFCTRCGSIEHLDDNCDWVAPPTCPYCGLTSHIAEDCPHNTNVSKTFGRGTLGNITEPPWVQRGQKIEYQEPDEYSQLNEIWKIDNDKWDPVVANARLIILEFIAENVRHPTIEAKAASMEDPEIKMIVREARVKLDEHIGYVEPRLRNYVDMVVGGELRHHRSVGGRIIPGPNSRPLAWRSWKKVRDLLGSQALLDAIILFEDFTDRSFGGVKWGIPAKILWLREQGKITPEVFCDRVFDLEHNGGCLLNKIAWHITPRNDMFGRYDISSIKKYLGPARAADEVNWELILHFLYGTKYEDEARLFLEYWNRANLITRSTHMEPLETPRIGKTLNGRRRRRSAMVMNSITNSPLPYFDGTNDTCGVCGQTFLNEWVDKYYCEANEDCWSKTAVHNSTHYMCATHYDNCEECGVLICPCHEYLNCGCDESCTTENPYYIGKESF